MADRISNDARLVRNVEEAAQLLGISRTLAYELVGRGEIPALRLGRRLVVPLAALNSLLNTASESRADLSAHLNDSLRTSANN